MIQGKGERMNEKNKYKVIYAHPICWNGYIIGIII